MEQQFSLRWDHYFDQITEAFGSLRHKEDLVDVTLSCEGRKIKAHKMLLSACSSYFREIFKENPCQHPVIVFQNVKFVDLKSIIDFIYQGEVNVLNEQLGSFLSTAEMLEVKGLTEKENEDDVQTTGITETVNNQGKEQPIIVSQRKECSMSSSPSFLCSPPRKRRKSNQEENEDERLAQSETVVVKEEMEDPLYIENEEGIMSDETDPEPPSHSALKFRKTGCESATTQKTGEAVDDSIPDDTIEEQFEEIFYEQKEGNESIKSQKPITSNNDVINPKTSTTILHQIKANIKEVEHPLESETKPLEAECISASKEKEEFPVKKAAEKCKISIPKGLTVTSVQAIPKVRELFDFPNQEPTVVEQEEDVIEIRSEHATTPVNEGATLNSGIQQLPAEDDMMMGQIPQNEPEIAEQAPDMQEEQTEPEASVEEEPEFDYYGCEVCKNEARPVDRFTFNHKCPICPCACFCAHLLKEHMRAIHGWFNVQRRYTQY